MNILGEKIAPLDYARDKILDIGCGEGWNVIEVSRRWFFEWSLYWLFRPLIGAIPALDRTGNDFLH